mgnify:FL=1
MKYFAKIDENNLILTIEVLNDDVAPDENTGITFLKNFYKNENQKWKMCEKSSGGTPGTVASIGGTWDETNQGFWAIQPYPSWTKNNSTWKWDAPVLFPSIANDYSIWWDEENLLWKATKLVEDPKVIYNWNSDTFSWNIA